MSADCIKGERPAEAGRVAVRSVLQRDLMREKLFPSSASTSEA
ncbi:hypothetical protein SAMN05519103_09054 [Rhizobiales bacterium GAS113]|nr:hypothetical protein SAMN05519103_09054 [Rhizobiales bacterium GAS113]